jgi:hypothetical protein
MRTERNTQSRRANPRLVSDIYSHHHMSTSMRGSYRSFPSSFSSVNCIRSIQLFRRHLSYALAAYVYLDEFRSHKCLLASTPTQSGYVYLSHFYHGAHLLSQYLAALNLHQGFFHSKAGAVTPISIATVPYDPHGSQDLEDDSPAIFVIHWAHVLLSHRYLDVPAVSPSNILILVLFHHFLSLLFHPIFSAEPPDRRMPGSRELGSMSQWASHFTRCARHGVLWFPSRLYLTLDAQSRQLWVSARLSQLPFQATQNHRIYHQRMRTSRVWNWYRIFASCNLRLSGDMEFAGQGTRSIMIDVGHIHRIVVVVWKCDCELVVYLYFYVKYPL